MVGGRGDRLTISSMTEAQNFQYRYQYVSHSVIFFLVSLCMHYIYNQTIIISSTSVLAEQQKQCASYSFLMPIISQEINLMVRPTNLKK